VALAGSAVRAKKASRFSKKKGKKKRVPRFLNGIMPFSRVGIVGVPGLRKETFGVKKKERGDSMDKMDRAQKKDRVDGSKGS